MKHLLSFCLTFLFGILLLPAQILNWDYNDMLTDVQEAGVNPDMVIDDLGNLHVSFWSNANDRLCYAKRNKATHTWSVEYPDMQNYGGYKSAITLDANKKVHIAYYKNILGVAYLEYVTNKSGAWVTESIEDTMALGNYGENTIARQYFQPSIDIELQANGVPFIACFDATTDFAPLNYSCPYFNDKLNIFYAYKTGNNWTYAHIPTTQQLLSMNANQCDGLNDRFGEFLRVIPAKTGGFHLFTNSYFNHKIIKLQTNGSNLNQWSYATIDSASRSTSGISAAYTQLNSLSASSEWVAYNNIVTGRLPGSDTLYMMYNFSDMYGNGTNSLNYAFFTRLQHESVTTIPPFYQTISNVSSKYFTYFTIAPFNANVTLFTYYDRVNGGLYAVRTLSAGQQFLETDTILTGNLITQSSMCSGIYGDSLFLLVHDALTNELKLTSKKIGDVSSGAAIAWKWETATKMESRAHTLASQVAHNTNGDVLHVAFDEKESGQLYYGQKIGTANWTYTKIGTPNADDVCMAMMVSSPYVAYIQSNNHSLKGAYKSGGNWLTETIASTGNLHSPAITSIGNQLHLVYNDVQSHALMYAKGTAGGTWTTTMIDNTGDIISKIPSITSDANGGIHVAYIDVSKQQVKYAYKPATGTWVIKAITDSISYIPVNQSIQVNSNGQVFIAFMDGSQKKIFVSSPNTSNIWTAEMAVNLNNNSQYGNPMKFKLDLNDRLWILYNYPNSTSKELRLSRKDPFNGQWYSVSVNNNLGQVGEVFDFNLPSLDFYIFGKKNKVEDNGLAYLVAVGGASTDITQQAMQENLLATCYPNPASDVVYFQCQNPEIQNITIRIYDINGKEIAEISDKNAAIGEWNKAFDMTALSAGVYFCKWQVGNISFVQKLMK